MSFCVRWIYRRNIVVDGNFSLEHMKMKSDANDVSLNDGEGYMVEWLPYKQHLEASFETKQVSNPPYLFTNMCHCHPIRHPLVPIIKQLHRPMQTGKTWMPLVLVHVHVLAMAAFSLTQWLTFKKVNGMYTAGCFDLCLVVPFPRQMNVDYSICQALSYNSAGLTEALIEYDVACQWSLHFLERVDASKYLHLPPDLLVWIPAIGKFHLAAHIKECFHKHSLNFVYGAGQQDGEILETLWSGLNKAAGSIRAMSKAHRQEVLDDLMRDSNWKKLTKIGECYYSDPFSGFLMFAVKSLGKKHRKAVEQEKESHIVWEELHDTLDEDTRQQLMELEQLAMEFRGDHLKIYEVHLPASMCSAECALTFLKLIC
jgi:hypothetical protein